MVNQVETHVFQQQKKAHAYMEKYGVQHESWGPFAEGKNNFFTNPVLGKIGEKYGKSLAQIALCFLIQSNVVVIPKSTHKERMAQNLDVFDFKLEKGYGSYPKPGYGREPFLLPPGSGHCRDDDVSAQVGGKMRKGHLWVSIVLILVLLLSGCERGKDIEQKESASTGWLSMTTPIRDNRNQ